MQEFIQICHCGVVNCILSQLRQSVLQKLYILSLELYVIYRPHKSCHSIIFKNLLSDVSYVANYETITVANTSGISYC